MNQQQPAIQPVQVRKTPKGWNIQVDDATWVQLMEALTLASEVSDQDGNFDQGRAFRALRSALSKAQ